MRMRAGSEAACDATEVARRRLWLGLREQSLAARRTGSLCLVATRVCTGDGWLKEARDHRREQSLCRVVTARVLMMVGTWP